MTSPMRRHFWQISIYLAVVLIVLTGLSLVGNPEKLTFDDVWIHEKVLDLGVFGPLALIGLMVLAIVVSPIPSGPIAVAAGTLYGTAIGAAISILGAEIGALLAFSAARFLGYDAVRRSENRFLKFMATPRSPSALMGIVFVSRLIPFISFDAVSYAAGLTNLSFWRFAIATSFGIVPICWILAAMGAGIVTDGLSWTMVILLGGGLTLVSALFLGIGTYLKK